MKSWSIDPIFSTTRSCNSLPLAQMWRQTIAAARQAIGMRNRVNRPNIHQVSVLRRDHEPIQPRRRGEAMVPCGGSMPRTYCSNRDREERAVLLRARTVQGFSIGGQRKDRARRFALSNGEPIGGSTVRSIPRTCPVTQGENHMPKTAIHNQRPKTATISAQRAKAATLMMRLSRRVRHRTLVCLVSGILGTRDATACLA